MKDLLVGVYKVCSNKSPVVKIGPAPGGHCFPFMYKGKNFKNAFLKSLRARAKIFSTKHLLMGVYHFKLKSNKSINNGTLIHVRKVEVTF
jgi:hypothetical protein